MLSSPNNANINIPTPGLHDDRQTRCTIVMYTYNTLVLGPSFGPFFRIYNELI